MTDFDAPGIRTYRAGDGPGLRELWVAVDFHVTWDDDRALATFARRNPGLFLVAEDGERIVASAMAGWDGRRGWIYHVTTDEALRNRGIASLLLQTIEARLKALGCRRANLLVREYDRDALEFWLKRGYVRGPIVALRKDL